MQIPGRGAIFNKLDKASGEKDMIVRRRNWYYRLAGQHFARVITFRNPITATKVKAMLRRTDVLPVELWGCSP